MSNFQPPNPFGPQQPNPFGQQGGGFGQPYPGPSGPYRPPSAFDPPPSSSGGKAFAWVLIGVISTVVVLCCGCGGVLMWLGGAQISKEQQAVVKHLNAHPKAIELLGQPIEASFMAGDDKVFGDEADDVYKITGPKGQGNANVTFDDDLGAEIISIELDFNGQRHDLTPGH